MVKHMPILILSVFMLQFFAAGFCMPMASASPVEKSSMVEHCMSSTMPHMDMQHEQATQPACAHCDLPDIHVTLDKDVLVVDDWVAFVVVAIVGTTADVATVLFLHSPPDLYTAQKQLTTYNLNLRFRV